MKKSAAAFLIIIFALAFTLGFASLPDFVAHADDASETYIMGTVTNLGANTAAGSSAIPVNDVITGSVLFYLPESYYAKVISKNTALDSYIVEYAGISNLFVKIPDAGGKEPETVSFSAGVSPYPNLLLQLADNASLTLGGSVVLPTDGYTVKFLGFNGGDVYVSASKNDVVLRGLAPKSAFNAFSVPYHPITENVRQSLVTPPSDGGQVLAPKSSQTLRIILIIGIIVPAVIIVFLLFKPSKDSNNYDKRAVKHKRFDEYDYDRGRRYDGKDYDRGHDPRGRDYDSRYSPDRDYRSDRSDRSDRYDRDYEGGAKSRDYRNRDYRDNPRDDDRGRYDK